MSIGGIGGSSFWQQDQSYWNQSQSFYTQDQNYLQNQQAISQQESADSSLFSAMGTAQTLETTGLAQIATQEAQTRVNNQIAADEKQLSALSGSTSSSTTPSGPAPATGTGTVPLTTSTTLASLRIPPGGAITVSDGTNTTTYQSTGTDTVGDLITAINANVAGNAYVTATLNAKGNLVIAGKDMRSRCPLAAPLRQASVSVRQTRLFSQPQGQPAIRILLVRQPRRHRARRVRAAPKVRAAARWFPVLPQKSRAAQRQCSATPA